MTYTWAVKVYLNVKKRTGVNGKINDTEISAAHKERREIEKQLEKLCAEHKMYGKVTSDLPRLESAVERVRQTLPRRSDKYKTVDFFMVTMYYRIDAFPHETLMRYIWTFPVKESDPVDRPTLRDRVTLPPVAAAKTGTGTGTPKRRYNMVWRDNLKK
jgi:hypothetical protein